MDTPDIPPACCACKEMGKHKAFADEDGNIYCILKRAFIPTKDCPYRKAGTP